MQKLRSILLVDDDEVTNFINTELIESLQVTNHLKVCENGKEAMDYLTLAHSHAGEEYLIPDIIFLDVNMPVMNGMEFLEAYKSSFKECDTIITMLSTTQIQQEVFQTLTTTNLVVSFIEKPLTKEKITDLVNGIIRVYYHNCKAEDSAADSSERAPEEENS
ncbi:MAG: response regulator [Pedobacter sp.]|nr:MAG: response regulator [Pedobacter sp.]